MTERKLSKRQRAKLISPADRIRYERMEIEEILAVHDLMHALMLRKSAVREAIMQELADEAQALGLGY